MVEELPPRRPSGTALLDLLIRLPVELATAGVDIDLAQLPPCLTLPDIAADVEEDDDEEREVGVEEVVDCHWVDGSVELNKNGQPRQKKVRLCRLTCAQSTMKMRNSASIDPHLPNGALNGSSSTVWP